MPKDMKRKRAQEGPEELKDSLSRYVRAKSNENGVNKWKPGAEAKFVRRVERKLDKRAKPAALFEAAALLCEEHELPMPKGVTAALLDAGLSLDSAVHGRPPVLHALLEAPFPPPLLPT